VFFFNQWAGQKANSFAFVRNRSFGVYFYEQSEANKKFEEPSKKVSLVYECSEINEPLFWDD